MRRFRNLRRLGRRCHPGGWYAGPAERRPQRSVAPPFNFQFARDPTRIVTRSWLGKRCATRQDLSIRETMRDAGPDSEVRACSRRLSVTPWVTSRVLHPNQ